MTILMIVWGWWSYSDLCFLQLDLAEIEENRKKKNAFVCVHTVKEKRKRGEVISNNKIKCTAFNARRLKQKLNTVQHIHTYTGQRETKNKKRFFYF